MIVGITAIIFSVVYILLLMIVYFSKKRIKGVETNIYNILIIVDVLSLLLEFGCCFLVPMKSTYELLNIIVNRTFLITILTWMFMFCIYMFLISFNSKKNRTEKQIKQSLILFLILYAFSFLSIIIFPLEYYYDGIYVYSYGASTNILYIISGMLTFLATVFIIINIRNLKPKKYIPMIIFIICIILVLIIRNLNPGILLISVVQSFITVIMYFTIENPDLKMINELELAKNQADKANNAKSDFLSSMSHEIRTPLNAIVGFSECIMQTDDVDEAHDNAKDVVNASETLLEIVNGILDISKIEAGKLEIVNSNYDPKKLFDDVSRLIKARIGEKPLDFQVLIAEDLPNTLYGDHANLKKIIINLLTNAVKYTEKGFVKFEVSSVKTNGVCRLMINVSDSGRGIKKENIDKLFTKFQRLDEDKNTTIEGTGLGLAITKQLTELMKGKIVVNSVYGEGSKFTVAIDQRISLEQVEKEKESNLELDLTGKRILIVDDNKLNLKVSSKLLSVYNPTIDLLEDGFSCIEKIKNNVHYDLILMDDMMPKMTGTETLQKLKEIEYFNIPVIALTANAISGMREKYLKEGFDDYLSKPMEKDEVYKVLLKYTNKDIKKEYPIKKILIVDDNNMNIKIVSNFLKQYNLVIDSALSGDECIKKINNGILYDLILMDDMMPITTGTQTMKRLKLLSFKNPIVALTANAVEGAKEQYLKEGFDDYLSKPINKNELDRVMDKFLYKQNISKIEDISM